MNPHKTRIASSKLYQGIKMPFETRDVGNGYAASGEVVTYHMSQEEIARRYPAQPKQKRDKPSPFVMLNRYQKGVGKVKESKDTVSVAQLIVEVDTLKNRIITDTKRIEHISELLEKTMVEI